MDEHQREPVTSSSSPGQPTGLLLGTAGLCKPSLQPRWKGEKLLETVLGGGGGRERWVCVKKPHKPPNLIELLPKEYAERLRLRINYCLSKSSILFSFFFSFFLFLPFHSLVSLWFAFFSAFSYFSPSSAISSHSLLCFSSSIFYLFSLCLFVPLLCSLQERRVGHLCDLVLILHLAWDKQQKRKGYSKYFLWKISQVL